MTHSLPSCSRGPSHAWTNIYNSDDEVIGYCCPCGVSESTGQRRDRELEEAAIERARVERVRERARLADEREGARQRAAELVVWRCDGCRLELQLERRHADRRSFCCRACAKRRRRLDHDCSPCASCGTVQS